MEARVRNAPNAHVVTEIKIDGRWALFDPDGSVFFRNPNNTVASLDEVRGNLDLLSTARSNIYPEASLREVYTRGNFNLKTIKSVPAEGFHQMRFQLRPGESITYSRERKGVFFATDFFEEPVEYANGVWSFQPRWSGNNLVNEAVEVANFLPEESGSGGRISVEDESKAALFVYHFNSPFPVVGGTIGVQFENANTAGDFIEVSASRDQENWEPLESISRGDNGMDFTLSKFCNNAGGLPDQDFYLKVLVKAQSSVRSLNGVVFRFDLQMAPRALPLPMEAGDSVRIDFSSPSHGNLSLGLTYAPVPK
jgi:hypothetical protein